MLQINPFLDCTLYSRIVVHIVQNNHAIACFFPQRKKLNDQGGSICRNVIQHLFHRGVNMPECQVKKPSPGGSIVRNGGSIKSEQGVN